MGRRAAAPRGLRPRGARRAPAGRRGPRGGPLAFLEQVRGAGGRARDLVWRRAPAADEAAVREEARRAGEALVAAAAFDPEVLLLAREAVAEIQRSLAEGEGERAFRLVAADRLVEEVRPAKGRGPHAFTRARQALRDALVRLAALALDAWAEAEVAPGFVAALAAVEEEYARLRDERGALDFTDLEIGSLRLLEDLGRAGRRPAHAPARAAGGRVPGHESRCRPRSSPTGSPTSPQFSVGDPKQSIYRFRRADVGAILREAERVGEPGRHVLSATFRARPELGGRAQRPPRERLLADGAAGVAPRAARRRGGSSPRRPGRTSSSWSWTPGRTRRRTSAAAGGGPLPRPVDPGPRRRRRPAGEDPALAGRDAPSPPERSASATSPSSSAPAPALSIYEDALAAAGSRSTPGRGGASSRPRRSWTSSTSCGWSTTPADDHALACVATGPVLGATDADLLRWFPRPVGGRSPGAGGRGSASPAERAGRAAQVVSPGSRPSGARRSPAASPGWSRGRSSTSGCWRSPSSRTTEPAAPRTSARRSPSPGTWSAPAGTTSRTSSARSTAAGSARSRRRKPPLGREGEDAVRLTTVHGAKGLEFPVVVLADVGRPPPTPRIPALLHDGERGFTARRHPLEGTPLEPAGHALLREGEAAREEEESRRLLYVATTRAEERLLLLGSGGRAHQEGPGSRPARFLGWGRTLLEAFGQTPGREPEEIPLGPTGRARAVLLADPPPAEAAAAAPVPVAPPGAAAVAEAERVLAESGAPVAPLGGTPYVVTVTDLLQFAHSPAAALRAAARAPPGPGASGAAGPRRARGPRGGGRGGGAGRRAPRGARGAVGRGPPGLRPGRGAGRRRGAPRAPSEAPSAGPHAGLDRAALGRAVHAAIERLAAEPPDDEAVARAGGGVARRRAARRGGGRGPDGRALPPERGGPPASPRRSGGARTCGARSSFHARIRFPGGARVGDHDALLVRGSIDLWLPEEGGVRIVDHKTNPPTRAHRTPADLARHYAVQLRLYALAAERLLGRDVAGASLLLLDEGWGPAAVEVAVDVAGEGLEDARRLCQAYALAALEGRWPADWHDLVEGPWDGSRATGTSASS